MHRQRPRQRWGCCISLPGESVCSVVITNTKIPIGWAEGSHPISDSSYLGRHCPEWEWRKSVTATSGVRAGTRHLLRKNGSGWAQPLLHPVVQTLGPFGDKTSNCLAKLNDMHFKVHIWKNNYFEKQGNDKCKIEESGRFRRQGTGLRWGACS